MPNTDSLMALHFRYRIWIAEMNADITLLRIFNDYTDEITSKKSEPDLDSAITKFQQQFISLRKEIDELRHEMQLCKMTLAADSKVNKASNGKLSLTGNHTALKKRYVAFKRTFDTVKREFEIFEGKWL